jgi:hypothetical protein
LLVDINALFVMLSRKKIAFHGYLCHPRSIPREAFGRHLGRSRELNCDTF